MDTAVHFDHLVQTLFPGSKLVRAWDLKGGISAEMTALEITGADGSAQRWIVRRPGPSQSADMEYRVLQLLHSLGLAVPAPLALDLSGAILPGPYMVMEYIDGQPDFSPANPLDCAVQMADALAKIHAVGGERAELAFLPRFAERSELDHRPERMNESMQEGRIRAVLETAWPLLIRNAPALLHGDYWPGNILWKSGRLAAVVDWEDAAVGDPLADVAISRLDLLWIYSREAMEAFTRRYLDRSAADPRTLPYWDLHAALRLIRLAGEDLESWAAFFQPYGRMDITARSILEQYQWFVEQALGKILTPGPDGR